MVSESWTIKRRQRSQSYKQEWLYDRELKASLASLETPWQILPSPPYIHVHYHILRECKSGLECFAHITFHYSGSVPKWVKLKNNFSVPSPMVTQPGLTEDFSYHEVLWYGSFIGEILSPGIGSTEAITLLKGTMLTALHSWFPHTQLIHRYAHRRLRQTLSLPHMQWHTFIDIRRYTNRVILSHSAMQKYTHSYMVTQTYVCKYTLSQPRPS